MWIAYHVPTRGTGWVSISAKDEEGQLSGMTEDAIVSARFRRLEDAQMLFPDHMIEHTPKGDYEYRVFVERGKMASMLSTLMMGLAYDNFKNQVPEHDTQMHDALMDVWSTMAKTQATPPYGLDWDYVLPSVGG